MAYWLRLFRIQNLLIIALCQISLAWLIDRNTSISIFKQSAIYMLVSVTVLTAAWGNVHNDLVDQSIDANKSSKRLIIGPHLRLQQVKSMMYVLLFLTISLTGLLILSDEFGWEAYIPLISFFLLFFYNKALKHRGIWGNIIISILTTNAILLIYVWARIDIPSENLIKLFVFFAGFSFLTTWFREMVKDVEDLDADKIVGSKSFAITKGPKAVLQFSNALHLLTLAALVVYTCTISSNTIHRVHVVLVIILGIYLFYWYRKKWIEGQWTAISRIYKWFMLAGISLLWTF